MSQSNKVSVTGKQVQVHHSLIEKRRLLEYYVLEKQLKFMDAVRDDDGSTDANEAIQLFLDPFLEEKDYDADGNIHSGSTGSQILPDAENGIDVNPGVP